MYSSLFSCKSLWCGRTVPFLYFTGTVEQFPRPQSIEVTKKEEENFKQDGSKNFWEKKLMIVGEPKTIEQLKVSAPVKKYLETITDLNKYIRKTVIIEEGGKTYSLKMEGTKKNLNLTAFEVKFNEEKYTETIKKEEQLKRENLFKHVSLDVTIKKGDTLSELFRKNMKIDRTAERYEYTQLDEFISYDAAEKAVQTATTELMTNLTVLPKYYEVDGKLVYIEKDEDGKPYPPYEFFFKKEFDTEEYKKDEKKARTVYLGVMNALAQAGINPNMVHPGDRIVMKDGVIYLDMNEKGNHEKNIAITLYESATITPQERPTDTDPTKNEKRDYKDATNKSQELKIAETHKAIEKARDALARGTLFDVFRAYNIPFTDLIQKKIWTEKMEKTDQFTGSTGQNLAMLTYFKKLGDKKLKALAQEILLK